MNDKPIKRLLLKVSICRENKDQFDLFTTDNVLDLNLKDPHYKDGCKFIEVGDILTFENKKYKVDRIVFRLDPPTTLQGTNLDLRTDNEDAWESNCQLSILVSDHLGN